MVMTVTVMVPLTSQDLDNDGVADLLPVRTVMTKMRRSQFSR